ncbi:MAG: mechanosensitive ion channel [Candidatus Zixiibacteriota bacterium]|nr:MAG: mechanosensitive ion channel [candidate division Zixibacteria bacterium]
MEILEKFFQGIESLIPTAAAVVGAVVVVSVIRYVLEKRYAGAPGHKFRLQMVTMVLSLVGLLVVIIVLPVSESLRGRLLSLLGILLSAAIALSSTTFIGNIMAGLMLRAVRGFRPGDFIRVGDNFGRVSEQSLFHVEIQTEDRDLTTMPNLYLVTNPVKVIRTSGTIVSADVSLGYDVPRTRIEQLLVRAAAEVPLKDPFVLILELGDFSVTYRVSGLLEEVKHILSTRSRLRELVLDHLHRAGVEIVSPTFMNTRSLAEARRFIPPEVEPKAAASPPEKPAPEKVVFDKAEQAESLEKLRERFESMGKDIAALKENIGASTDPGAREELAGRLERLEKTRQTLADVIKQREEEQDS